MSARRPDASARRLEPTRKHHVSPAPSPPSAAREPRAGPPRPARARTPCPRRSRAAARSRPLAGLRHRSPAPPPLRPHLAAAAPPPRRPAAPQCSTASRLCASPGRRRPPSSAPIWAGAAQIRRPTTPSDLLRLPPMRRRPLAAGSTSTSTPGHRRPRSR
nr:serine/arginine repetitive matrix protein 1-like [Aegilops tauschii subsp. strangulata]